MKKRRAIRKWDKPRGPKPKKPLKPQEFILRGFVAMPLRKDSALTTFALRKGDCINNTEMRLKGLTMEEAGLEATKCLITLKTFPVQ